MEVAHRRADAAVSQQTRDGVELTEVQRILGHHSILTTVRYTHLTEQTRHHAIERINALMDRYCLAKGTPR
jgi:site-specific recombinase XerD